MKSKIKFYRRKIVIPVENGEEARYYSDLMYASFLKPHCLLHFSDGAEYQVKISVRTLLKHLPEKPFFQCNRTDIINLCYYEKHDSEKQRLILQGGYKFGLSVRCNTKFGKKKAYMQCLSPPCPKCIDCNKEKCKDYLQRL